MRPVYEVYAQPGLSINAIARLLNEEHIPTRPETTRWERSTIWGLQRTRRTGGGRALGRPSSVRGSASRGGCVNAKGCEPRQCPPYWVVPVVRGETLERHPEVREALNLLGGKISDEEMRRLNYAVDGEHRDLVEVVREFLRSKRLD